MTKKCIRCNIVDIKNNCKYCEDCRVKVESEKNKIKSEISARLQKESRHKLKELTQEEQFNFYWKIMKKLMKKNS